MKMFIWNGNLETGAYHQDGGCGVIANSVSEAVKLLALDEASPHETYRYAEAAKNTPPHATIEVSSTEDPRVVWRYEGCDC